MRRSGVLLHITSLPTPGGIGTLGKAAFEFIDFLKASGTQIWQMLPVGPTGYAESPYQSSSTYAGNPLMIDLQTLEDEGILPTGSYTPLPNTASVDFEAVKEQSRRLLALAYTTSKEVLTPELEAFRLEQPRVSSFALFYAVKEHFSFNSWMTWPDPDIRLRRPEALAHYSELLADRISYYVFEQYLFFRQWKALRAYAVQNGIQLLGDMPIYVAEDSADVWLSPDLFELDDDCRPIRIAGVPPDYFQADGQRWGNPLYRWDRHQAQKYAWWIARLRALGSMFDIIRIDHFIGFANYYAIPATEPTARNGRYELGPDKKLFRRIKKELPNLQIVAEDLGVINARVKRLISFTGYPGMKVLQFAFYGDETSPDLPAHHGPNSVVYTGTHDNDTAVGWWSTLPEDRKAFAREQLGMRPDSDDIVPALQEAAFGSACETCIVPMQDLLGCDGSARMNTPGTVGGNWLWRMLPQDLTAVSRRLRILNRRYSRGIEAPVTAEAIVAAAEAITLRNCHAPLSAATPQQLHNAVSEAVMTAIAPRWADDAAEHLSRRHALYLSAEYLVGRLIYNNLYSLGLLESVRDRLAEKGISLADLEDIEDAALGNGGLGRLAACFLDSAATHDIPLDGYGLRYRYGLFKQSLVDGRQVELPDDWTAFGDPWSIRRDDLSVIVPMKGCEVRAVPYDMPVIGYGKGSIGTLRLWQCESTHEFDFERFNAQDYRAAVEEKDRAEDITRLLYPNDSTRAGKLLRLRQQYVLCSASLQDMLRAYRAVHGGSYARFAELHAVQLNDTHPTMAIPELIRLLMEDGVSFAEAFELARQTFRYTNHTVMREALEQWDVRLLGDISPELVRVIRRIDSRLKAELRRRHIADTEPLAIISDGRVRMANLAVYGTSFTNGVAAIHSELLKTEVFREWYALYPERFQNKTNGITQRRWLGLCDPELCALLDREIGPGYMTDLSRLEALRPLIDDRLAADFIEIKHEKKRQLAALILEREGIELPLHFVFDVQVKRLHEYKRQLLNAFSILDIYYGLKDGTLTDFPATAFIFGAKAAPGYARAKAIIRFINQIADLVNNDPEVSDRMRVVFVRNYNCSYAEHIIPAADLSEQISPAGTEASGTGNMKLMLNGACTVGTFDGANIEIVEQAGLENSFIFGATVEQLAELRPVYDPKALYRQSPRLARVVDALNGTFPDEDGALKELYTSLLEGASWHAPDHYFLLQDFESYADTRLRAIRATKDPIAFARKCLYNIAGAGRFSSDRTIREYAHELWSL